MVFLWAIQMFVDSLYDVSRVGRLNHSHLYKGEIIKNVEIEFDDYMWECINPNMGG